MKERPIPFKGPMVRAILDGRKTQTRRIMKIQPPPDARVTVEHYNRIVFDRHGDMQPGKEVFGALWDGGECGLPCPYGAPGDHLWVRETFCSHWGTPPHDAPPEHRIMTGDELPPIKQDSGEFYKPETDDRMTIWYGTGGNKPFHMKWKPSMFMPRWASRITLRITDIRVERLQGISEEDARAEGVEAKPFPGPWWQGYRDDIVLGELMHTQSLGETPPEWMIEPKRMSLSHLDLSARDVFRSLWNSINGPGAWDANPWVWVISFERVEP
ncbi:MAG: hypothetical protein INF64_01015 [Roseomonas sp.]|nr:hypothetical protein [Roseomonas sp.]